MVVIRLRRGGRTHDPHYRLVAQEKRSKLNGAYIENLGHYHPTDPKKQLELNKERLEHWLKNGATLSDAATNLLVKAGILPAERRVVRLGVTKKAVTEEATTETETKAEKVEGEVAEETPAESEPATEVAVEEAPVEEAAEAEAPTEEAV